MKPVLNLNNFKRVYGQYAPNHLVVQQLHQAEYNIHSELSEGVIHLIDGPQELAVANEKSVQ